MFNIEQIAITNSDLSAKVTSGVNGILPEILLAGFFVVLLIFDVLTKGKQTEIGRALALIGIISTAAVTTIELVLLEPRMTASFFNGSIPSS